MIGRVGQCLLRVATGFVRGSRGQPGCRGRRLGGPSGSLAVLVSRLLATGRQSEVDRGTRTCMRLGMRLRNWLGPWCSPRSVAPPGQRTGGQSAPGSARGRKVDLGRCMGVRKCSDGRPARCWGCQRTGSDGSELQRSCNWESVGTHKHSHTAYLPAEPPLLGRRSDRCYALRVQHKRPLRSAAVQGGFGDRGERLWTSANCKPETAAGTCTSIAGRGHVAV